jgi:hypothetical protein
MEPSDAASHSALTQVWNEGYGAIMLFELKASHRAMRAAQWKEIEEERK